MFAPVFTDITELIDWRTQHPLSIIVATNGCFDLLHRGHVEHLAKVANYGMLLVVGLNGDKSVRKLKGPTRPIQNENDRAKILSALRSVHAVYIFQETRATNFLTALRPNIYVKGGDYTVDSLNKSELKALKKCDAKIIILPRIGTYSTTNLIKAR